MEGKRNRRGRAAALVAVVGHLVLVVMGALQIHPEGDGWLARALAYYGALSGAESGYAFFAHSITPLPRASFLVSDAGGMTIADALEYVKKGHVCVVDVRVVPGYDAPMSGGAASARR